ncbi:MAG: hypothetical protein ACD_28C00409G0018 [uncultured bacterium]|nr:MAG: hypothetical protein ACD_28C00409G0018 [uncultured bacterium]
MALDILSRLIAELKPEAQTDAPSKTEILGEDPLPLDLRVNLDFFKQKLGILVVIASRGDAQEISMDSIMRALKNGLNETIYSAYRGRFTSKEIIEIFWAEKTASIPPELALSYPDYFMANDIKRFLGYRITPQEAARFHRSLFEDSRLNLGKEGKVDSSFRIFHSEIKTLEEAARSQTISPFGLKKLSALIQLRDQGMDYIEKICPEVEGCLSPELRDELVNSNSHYDGRAPYLNMEQLVFHLVLKGADPVKVNGNYAMIPMTDEKMDLFAAGIPPEAIEQCFRRFYPNPETHFRRPYEVEDKKMFIARFLGNFKKGSHASVEDFFAILGSYALSYFEEFGYGFSPIVDYMKDRASLEQLARLSPRYQKPSQVISYLKISNGLPEDVMAEVSSAADILWAKFNPHRGASPSLNEDTIKCLSYFYQYDRVKYDYLMSFSSYDSERIVNLFSHQREPDYIHLSESNKVLVPSYLLTILEKLYPLSPHELDEYLQFMSSERYPFSKQLEDILFFMRRGVTPQELSTTIGRFNVWSGSILKYVLLLEKKGASFQEALRFCKDLQDKNKSLDFAELLNQKIALLSDQ